MTPESTRHGEIYVYADAARVAQGAADWCVQTIAAVLADRARVAVALAGGTTPLAAYRLLASPTYRERIDWPRVEIFFGDERCVPPGDADSNYRAAREALLDHVPLRPDHVHRILGERPADEAAALYATLLRERAGEPPRLDLALLGMGADGHTASLFPGAAPSDPKALTLPVYRAEERRWRVSLSAALLSRTRHLAILVVGENKAATLATALGDEAGLPIQSIAAVDQRWLVDAAAATKWNCQV